MAQILTAPPTMSRQQRRRMERLAEDVDRVLLGDRRFFERRPERSFRLRLMAAPEREQLAIIHNKPVPTPDGEVWIVAVRKLGTGVRARQFLTVQHGADLDQPDDVCRAVFEAASGDAAAARATAAAIRAAAARGASA